MPAGKKGFWITWVAWLGLTVGVLAQAQEGIGPDRSFYPVYDFRDDYLVYDESYRTYVPYLNEQHSTIPATSVFIDLESNRHYSILLSSQKDAYLFINAALQRKLPARQWLVLNIDSLYQIYHQPEIFLTLYGTPGIEGKQLYLGYPKSATETPVVLSDEGLSIRPRPSSVFDDFFGLCLVFLLATHAFLYSFNRRAFLRFYSIRDLFSLRVREETFLINKPLSRITMLFLLNLSFVAAFLIMFVQSRNINLFSSRSLLLPGQQLPELIADFFLISAIAFVLLLGKYFVLYALGNLYRLEGITNIHYFKALQSSLLFFTGVVAILTVITYNVPDISWLNTYLMVPFVTFYLARLALLYLVITNVTPIKNLYLFSYLCIIELIPLIIGVRFAL
ncbi:hypothetical protein GCM10023187_15350 [Nibrella viscosa]|uniref:DUF4271 domain-containing protein n=1 Tax=Nibrella viscosa TaxID=1084524 RepID=A0ABP8K6V6_9BACT